MYEDETRGYPQSPKPHEAPTSWVTADRTMADSGGASQQYHGEPPRGPKQWLVPVLLVAAAIVGFAVVTFFISGGDETPASTQSSTVASAPSSTPSEPSAAEATFPDDSVTTCGQGDPITVPDIRIARESNTSCAYVVEIRSNVLAHLAQDSGATSFTINPYSVAKRAYVPLTCERSDHLSLCTGGTAVRAWVKDSVGP
ncbi:hypothetical protein [Dermacoccus barathri]|uniref:hypothetical protein n=1 Tax=Dermacoccus barathri TaxID=322601 RepID=UPI001879BB7F|nr:hypothetical protein [Dermacoccus barathri]MBE7372126.1 hypothetical protein [Dermacoccus barathri]